jgi:hypothetical protein
MNEIHFIRTIHYIVMKGHALGRVILYAYITSALKRIILNLSCYRKCRNLISAPLPVG